MTVETDSQTLPTPHGRLFVQRWWPAGQTPMGAAAKAPLLLLHDSLGCVALWRDFPQQLSAATGRTVIAYDRLGFGQSDAHPGQLGPHFVAEEVEQSAMPVLQALGVSQVAVMGHSVGGGMAAYVAAALGDRCTAAVIESAQTFAEAHTLDGIRVAREQFAQPGQLERLAKYHGDKAAWVLSAWVDTWLAPEFANYSIQPAVQQLRCPVLSIHGEQDEYGSLRHPQNIVDWARVPVVQEIVAGGGHVPHREQPERIVARIAQFLQPLD